MGIISITDYWGFVCSIFSREAEKMNQDKRKYKDRKGYLQKYQREYYHKNPKQKQRCLERNKRPEAVMKRKEWEQKHPEKIKIYQLKFRKSDKRNKYLNEYRKTDRFKRYQREWSLKNPDKVKERHDRYSKTDKGKLNQIMKVQNRRKKFKAIAGVYYDKPKVKIIRLLNERDKVCVYCHRNFNDDIKRNSLHSSYDHLNAFMPHSEINSVRCCNSCNGSKRDREVLSWCKMKGFKPAKIVYDLLELQKDKKS